MGDLREISKRLSDRYRDHRHYNKRGPIAEMIFILLSTRTEEYNYLRTYRALRERFPTWRSLDRAREEKIADVIKLGGLSRLKAKQIKRILTAIQERAPSFSMKAFRSLPDDELEAFLTSLPGVGVKIARCVMLYAFDRQVFPVDVHCWRVSKRLGLIAAKSSNGGPTKREMDELQSKIPPALRLALHVNFVSLGREFCLDPRPNCYPCPLLDLCPTVQSLTMQQQSEYVADTTPVLGGSQD